MRQLTTYVTLLAFAAERRVAVRRAAVERYLLPTGPTAANRTLLQQSIDGTGGQSDGRTPYRYIDRAA